MNTARVPPTRRPAWQALEAHYDKVRDLHLRDLFAPAYRFNYVGFRLVSTPR